MREALLGSSFHVEGGARQAEGSGTPWAGVGRGGDDPVSTLTRAESQVAVWLAEGKSVRNIARASGLTTNTLYWHLQQIYQKKSISRQVDLVRLVLSVAEFG